MCFCHFISHFTNFYLALIYFYFIFIFSHFNTLIFLTFFMFVMFLYFILYIESIYASICKYRVLIITLFTIWLVKKCSIQVEAEWTSCVACSVGWLLASNFACANLYQILNNTRLFKWFNENVSSGCFDSNPLSMSCPIL